ncbi:MAG: hypothetical protein PHR23_06700 [bacterium]|jgi:hypothetical protein|nr:hypothetical protein [bacterium]
MAIEKVTNPPSVPDFDTLIEPSSLTEPSNDSTYELAYGVIRYTPPPGWKWHKKMSNNHVLVFTTFPLKFNNTITVGIENVPATLGEELNLKTPTEDTALERIKNSEKRGGTTQSVEILPFKDTKAVIIFCKDSILKNRSKKLHIIKGKYVIEYDFTASDDEFDKLLPEADKSIDTLEGISIKESK